MNNRHPTELLSAYLDDEATTAEREEVARHLETCDGCRALLDDFRKMVVIAAQEEPPSIPNGMSARIVAALGARAPEPRWVFSLWSPLPLAVAAGLLVVVTGTWVLVKRQEEPQPVAASQAARVEGDEKDAGGALRSPGYIGTAERGARSAMQAPTTPVPAAAAPSPPASESPAPPKLAEKAAPAGEAEPGLLETDQAARLVAVGRTIVFERNGAKGTLTEDGLVTLVQDQATCHVDLSASPAAGEEVRSIFLMTSAPPAPHPAMRSDQAPAAAPSREPPAAEEKDTPPLYRVRVLSATSRPLAAADVDQVEDRLRHLLDVTARDLLEAGCGRR